MKRRCALGLAKVGLAWVWVTACWCASAAAGDADACYSGATRIPLSEQETLVSIDTVRENFNAHGFQVSFFAVMDGRDRDHQLQLVPIFEDGREELHLRSRSSADCLLADFKVMQIDSTVHLWRADREIGIDYLEPQPVRIRHYTLQHNAAGLPGRPLYYFEWLETTTAREPACDVGAALDDAALALTSARD